MNIFCGQTYARVKQAHIVITFVLGPTCLQIKWDEVEVSTRVMPIICTSADYKYIM